jgi:hypothetical protein
MLGLEEAGEVLGEVVQIAQQEEPELRVGEEDLRQCTVAVAVVGVGRVDRGLL